MKKRLSKLALAALLLLLGTALLGCSLPEKMDLFTQSESMNFRNLMPGDKREVVIQAANTLTEYDYVDVYMRAILHDEQSNQPVQEDVTSVEPSVAEMNEFLSHLHMTVDNVKDGAQTRIFDGHAAETDGLTGNVKLGSYRKGEVGELRVTIEMPIDLGNEYAGRAGEVDWLFTLEGKMDPRTILVKKVWNDKGYEKDRPHSVTITLYRDGEVYETVELSAANNWQHEFTDLPYEDEAANKVYEYEVKEKALARYKTKYQVDGNTVTVTNTRRALIQTGQLNWPVYVSGGLGLCILAVGVVLLLKRKNEHEKA